MIPIMTGVIPFGAVMGSVAADANISLLNSTLMNLLVFAGASQLAAVDLMTKGAPVFVVVITGLIINFRFILYSAAMSPALQHSNRWAKFFGAYFLTDQSFALMSANKHRLHTNTETVYFYFGSAVCMGISWNLSVLLGHSFGRLAPPTWGLEFAIPLSFIVLIVPTLKNRKYVLIACLSFGLSLVLKNLPLNLGLIATAFLSLAVAYLFTNKRVAE